MKKDTKEQLDEFKRQQEEAEKAAKQGEQVEEPIVAENWGPGVRKRKKGAHKEGIGGLKIRRTSTGDKAGGAATKDDSDEPTKAVKEQQKEAMVTGTEKAAEPKQTAAPPSASPSPSPAAAPGLGLAAYSSDEDD